MKRKPVIYQFTDIWLDTPVTIGYLAWRWLVFFLLLMFVQLIIAKFLYSELPLLFAWEETMTMVTFIIGFFLALLMTCLTYPIVWFSQICRIEIDRERLSIRSTGPFSQVSFIEADREDVEVVRYPAMRSGTRHRTRETIGVLLPKGERVYHLESGEVNLLLGELRKKRYAIARAAERPFVYHDIHRDERKFIVLSGIIVILVVVLMLSY